MKLFYKELDKDKPSCVFIYQMCYGHHVIMNISAHIVPKSGIVTSVYFNGKKDHYWYDGSLYRKRTDRIIYLERNAVKNEIIEMFKFLFFTDSNILEKVINLNEVNNHEVWDTILDRIENNQKILSVMDT